MGLVLLHSAATTTLGGGPPSRHLRQTGDSPGCTFTNSLLLLFRDSDTATWCELQPPSTTPSVLAFPSQLRWHLYQSLLLASDGAKSQLFSVTPLRLQNLFDERDSYISPSLAIGMRDSLGSLWTTAVVCDLKETLPDVT